MKRIGLLLAIGVAPGIVFAQASPAETRWHEFADNLFVFERAYQNSIILVATEAVLVMDTYNMAHAQALKQEIKERFNVPVQYVVYSHAHADHVRGAKVFADSAQFIAQQRQIDRLEFLSQFEDSIVTPDITFDEEYRFKFGDREVILRDFGLNHATGITVMYVPQDRILVAFDMVYPKRFPFLNSDYSPRGVLNTLKQLYDLDFDVSIVAHGPPATRAEFAEYIDFMDDLITQVKAIVDDEARTAGPFATLEMALRDVDLTRYESWGLYDERRNATIEGAFQSVFVGF